MRIAPAEVIPAIPEMENEGEDLDRDSSSEAPDVARPPAEEDDPATGLARLIDRFRPGAAHVRRERIPEAPAPPLSDEFTCPSCHLVLHRTARARGRRTCRECVRSGRAGREVRRRGSGPPAPESESRSA